MKTPGFLGRLYRAAAALFSDGPEWDAVGGRGDRYGRASAGVQVTPDAALNLTVAFACINAIATDLASLPLKVYQTRRNGSRKELRKHPVSRLLRGSPDEETTSMRWRQALMGHVLGWGNGFAEVTFDRDGYPTGLYLASPRDAFPERRPQDKRLFYRVKGVTVPPYRMLHVAGLGFDGITGYSPIAKAKEAIGLGLAAEQFGATWFGNGSHPKGILKTPNVLTKDVIDRLKADWSNNTRGLENQNTTAVLEQGLEWQTITVPPEDAQFLATRQFQVSEICRMYRVPPHKVGDYGQMQLASAAVIAANLDYMMTTLMPWAEAIEQEFNRKLFTEDERDAGIFCEHEMAAFLRGDPLTRWTVYEKQRNLGCVSPNDILRKENMDPLGPEGDLYLVPAQLVSLERAGKGPEPAPPPPGEPAPEGEDPDDPEANPDQPTEGDDDAS